MSVGLPGRAIAAAGAAPRAPVPLASSAGAAPRAPMPTPPVRAYSFTNWQVNNPTAPPPGDRLDGEYDRTNASVASTITWASVSLNTDGTIRDAIVNKNNLLSGLFDGISQDIIDGVQP